GRVVPLAAGAEGVLPPPPGRSFLCRIKISFTTSHIVSVADETPRVGETKIEGAFIVQHKIFAEENNAAITVGLGAEHSVAVSHGTNDAQMSAFEPPITEKRVGCSKTGIPVIR